MEVAEQFKRAEFEFRFGEDKLVPSDNLGAAFTAFPLSACQKIHDNSPIPVLMNDGEWRFLNMPQVIQGFRPYFMPMVAESEEMPGS